MASAQAADDLARGFFPPLFRSALYMICRRQVKLQPFRKSQALRILRPLKAAGKAM